MRLTPLARNAFLGVSLFCLGLPDAEAIEIFAPPVLAAHLDDGMITLARAGRGGGGMRHHGGGRAGMHRGGMHHRPGGAHRPPGGMHGNVNRNLNRNVNRNINRNVNRNINRNVNRNINRVGVGHWGSWARPGRYWWPVGGAVAAGAAMGWISAAAAASWAGAAPGPGLCWYYTDPSRRAGFWDACP